MLFSGVPGLTGDFQPTLLLRSDSRTPDVAARRGRLQDTSFYDLLAKVRGLARSLRTLEDSTRFGPAILRNGKASQAASTVSDGPLALNILGTATTLSSTEEINATPTSFSPFGPSFVGFSTAEATIDGIYNGAQGDMTITFVAKNSGNVGVHDLKFDVFDENDTKIDTLDLHKDPPGTPAYLKNGLIFTLSEGFIAKKDTFTIDVSTTVGSMVDPDLAFSGQRNSNPNLQYGFQVTEGSFDLNGTSIAVHAGDSINEVLARINTSNAGVTASFDSGTERLQFSQRTAGSEHSILFENDTSGFLSAMKLTEASPVPGMDDERKSHIADVPALSGISTGTFSINGTQLSVDVESDSLLDVLQRINGSAAGVIANYDSDDQVVSFESTDPNEDLTLDGESSNFFEVLNVIPGIYSPTVSTSGGSRISQSRRVIGSQRFTQGLRDIASKFRDLYSDAASRQTGETLLEIRAALKRTVLEHHGHSDTSEVTRARSQWGLGFNFANTDGRVMRVDVKSLSRAARNDASNLERHLFATAELDKDTGLILKLRKQLADFEKELREKVETKDGRGLAVDLHV